MAKHWSSYKKYQTSGSIAGVRFCVQPSLGTIGHVCGVCMDCGEVISEQPDGPFATIIEDSIEHYNTNHNTNQESE